MNYFTLFCTLFYFSLLQAESFLSDQKECQDYIKIGENYKKAQQNEHCTRAANAGSGTAQYIVGMAYGFAGNPTSEEEYYRLAASNRNIASYLALGHVTSKTNPWESIYWYQKFVYTKMEGYGYAALQISRILENLGEKSQAAYWLEACRTSPYEGCK